MKPNPTVAMILVGAMLAPPAIAGTLTSSDLAYVSSVRPGAGTRYAQMDEGTQAKIHAALHDPATASNPDARRRAIAYLLDQYRNGWLWSLGRR